MRVGLSCAVLAAILALAGCGPSVAKKTLCANNLRTLWTYQAQFGKREGGKLILPSATGSAFWIAAQNAGDAAKSPIEADVLVCPLSGKTGGKGVTTYRGPKADVNTLGSDAVVGCCSGIHSDGSLCVLKKDGSVHVVEKGEPLHARALAESQ